MCGTFERPSVPKLIALPSFAEELCKNNSCSHLFYCKINLFLHKAAHVLLEKANQGSVLLAAEHKQTHKRTDKRTLPKVLCGVTR